MHAHRAPHMLCRRGCGAEATGHEMRAHFTMPERRTPAGPTNAVRLEVRSATHGEPDANAFRHTLEAARRFRPRASCGTQLSANQMCARFTRCPKRPAASGDEERRRGTLKVKRGRPAGPRMKCGWGCGEQLTASRMRTHFTVCPERPRA